MIRRVDLVRARTAAVKAAKTSSRWAYHTHYAGGAETVSVREPNDHTVFLTSLHSWDYASVAGVSQKTALVHLRLLVKAGALAEDRRESGACRFRLMRWEAVEVGQDIIKELRQTGLPFEDEWRETRRLESVSRT